MPEYTLTAPDGRTFAVEADTVEQAHKHLNEFRQQQFSEKQKADIEASPAWTRPFAAAHDLGAGAIDTLTGGFLAKGIDKLAGGDEAQMHMRAAKDRAGWAGTALDVATAAKYLPTVIPRAVAAAGGGPAARTLVGAGTAAGEGAAYGGLSAAGHDQDVTQGAGIGAVTGILGNVAGNVANRATKWWKGIDDAPPKYNVRQLPANPTPLDRVNFAKAEAERAAAQSDSPLALQKAYKKEFDEVQTSVPSRGFSKAEREALDRIISEDPATKGSRVVGNALTNKLGLAAMGAGGFTAGNPILAMAGPLASAGTGKVLQGVSSGGTKEAVQDLRRLMYGTDKFKGPVSEEAKARLGILARQLGLEYAE